jgi:hypothetical protein
MKERSSASPSLPTPMPRCTAYPRQNIQNQLLLTNRDRQWLQAAPLSPFTPDTFNRFRDDLFKGRFPLNQCVSNLDLTSTLPRLQLLIRRCAELSLAPDARGASLHVRPLSFPRFPFPVNFRLLGDFNFQQPLKTFRYKLFFFPPKGLAPGL